MQRIIFYWQWERKGDTWILLNGVGRAVGMILILDESDKQPVFTQYQTDKGRVTV